MSSSSSSSSSSSGIVSFSGKCISKVIDSKLGYNEITKLIKEEYNKIKIKTKGLKVSSEDFPKVTDPLYFYEYLQDLIEYGNNEPDLIDGMEYMGYIKVLKDGEFPTSDTDTNKYACAQVLVGNAGILNVSEEYLINNSCSIELGINLGQIFVPEIYINK